MKTKIETIDRYACRVLHAQAKLALEQMIANEFEGVSVSLNPGTFTPGARFSFKVEIAMLAADGTAKTKVADTFSLMAKFFGLKPDDLGREFTFRGKSYKIVGLSPNRSRFPINAERVPDGMGFKFPADAVKAGLKP